MKILVIHGPNLNMLGQREESQYGVLTMEQINSLMKKNFPHHSFSFFQSNTEGDIITQLQNAKGQFDAVIINPGGYAHSSVAIRDALTLCKIPKIEVHLSNIASREDFRHRSLTAAACDGYISGFREHSYLAGVYLLETRWAENK
jgi:3-dehydroquinate dehydratase II